MFYSTAAGGRHGAAGHGACPATPPVDADIIQHDAAPFRDGLYLKRERASRKTSFWVYALCIFTMVFCVNAPAPLLELFRIRFELSPNRLAMLYSAYAGVVMLALPVFGRVSDRSGRRALVMAGLGLIASGSVGMAWANGFTLLVTGRLMQALGVAAMSAPAASALAELTNRRSHASSAAVTTVALAAGGASAPLFSGALAEMVPSFPAASLLCCAGMAGLLLLGVARLSDPMVVRRSDPLPDLLLPLSSQHGTGRGPALSRIAFWQACSGVFICFGVQTSFFTISGPIFSELLASHVLLTAGCAMCALMIASGTANILARQMSARAAIAAGMGLLAPGAAGFFVGTAFAPLIALTPAIVAIGLGHGFTYAGAMRLINETACHDKRAAYTSKFYVAIYAGGGLPVLLMGMLESSTGRDTAAATFGVVAAAAAAGLLIWLWGTRP